MRTRLVRFGTGFGRDKFEEVAVSNSLDELRDQLSALDLSLLRSKPILVLLSSEDSFKIYSKI